jgi:Cu2+-exporting ATPase
VAQALNLDAAGDLGTSSRLARSGKEINQASAKPTDQAAKVHALVVENMHCGGCMRSVEKALSNVDGVALARANLSARRVTVITHDDTVSADTLVQALGSAGFRASTVPRSAPSVGEDANRALLACLAVAGFAAANIMLLSVAVWAGIVSDMGPAAKTLMHWLSALIAVPAVAYAGRPFFRSAAAALAARRLNMDVPISLGVLLATGMSVFQTMRGSEQVYFDAAVTLLLFLLIGRYLDSALRSRAAGAAANLIGLRAMTASVVRADGRVDRLPADALSPGERILVAAGERIAADGIVVRGESDVDESLITGETRNKPALTGTFVHAGTVNLAQPIEIEAVATDERTLLAEIGRLMTAAEQGRGRYVRLADRAARLYAPGVHVLSLATLIGWLLMSQGWEASLTAAIAVLIITCPCALALAVPAVQVAASSRLFSRGVIVKAADGLERLAEVDTIVFDKTGTLTLGQPTLATMAAAAEATLPAAASLAQASRHPYARALVTAAATRGLRLGPADGVIESAGAGLERDTSAGAERLGSAAWVGADLSNAQCARAAIWYRAPGGPPVPFELEDRLRPDARDVVAELKGSGYRIELISGDREEAVAAAAREAGIAAARGAVRPDEKLRLIEAMKREGRRVLMVGDGLNDAPALAAAHASLSPSTAADISQSAADAVFQGERLAPIVEVLRVAQAARRLSLQNFALAIGYNAVFVPMAVVGAVTPLIAAAAMSASSLAVTLNALRLRHRHAAAGLRRIAP